MLLYTLAQCQLSQSSLVQENTPLQRVHLGVQIALSAEGRELPQRQGHLVREVSTKITIDKGRKLTAKQKRRLSQSKVPVLQ